jgi:anti-anti-sigma factor
MATQDEFTIEVRNGRVVMTGELDMENGQTMVASLLALAAEANRLALDLREVSFMDARGLRSLLSVKDAQPEVRVVAVSPRVERVLSITETYDALVDSDLSETG